MRNIISAFAVLASGFVVAPLFLYGEKFAKWLFDDTTKEMNLHPSAN